MADMRSGNHAVEASTDSLSDAFAGVGEVVADPGAIEPRLTLNTSAAFDSPGAAEGSQKPKADNDDTWEISESQTAKTYEDQKFGFWQTAAINTLNMFGTGPFITVPFLFAATVPAGPQVSERPDGAAGPPAASQHDVHRRPTAACSHRLSFASKCRHSSATPWLRSSAPSTP